MNKESSEKQGSAKESLGKIVAILMCYGFAYLFIGHLLGTVHIDESWSSDSKGDPITQLGYFALGWTRPIAVFGFFGFISIYITIILLSKLLARQPFKIIFGMIIIYSLLSMPHFIGAYKKTHIVPNRDLQNTPEQQAANKQIEKMILGNQKIRKKFTMEAILHGESVGITANVDVSYKAEKIDDGFYKITLEFKPNTPEYSGNEKGISELKELNFFDEVFTKRTSFLYSEGAALIDVEDGSLYGCYLTTDGECKRGISSIKIKNFFDSSKLCECQSYEETDEHSVTTDKQCTIISKPSCEYGKKRITTITYDDGVILTLTLESLAQ